MSIAKIIPFAEPLSPNDKIQLIQFLLTRLAQESGFSSQKKFVVDAEQGERMAAILQRMSDRQALSTITDPIAWQKEVREDRPLFV